MSSPLQELYVGIHYVHLIINYTKVYGWQRLWILS